MTKVIFGNHSSVIVPRKDRDSIRRFYCDVLGGKITKAEEDRDFFRLGDSFYTGFLYADVTGVYYSLLKYAENVQSCVITNCGHWVTEEKPDELAGQLKKFFN